MDSEDYEEGQPLFHTFGSHFKLIIKFLVGLSSVNWTYLECLLNSIKLVLMRTETLIFFISLSVIYICCHSSDVWPTILAKRIPSQWLLKLGLAKQTKPSTHNCSYSDELIVNNVGIYAIQGRRPKMEDTFSYCDESKRLGLQMFGVFDGHGGDSASNLVKARLFTSILEAIENSSTNPPTSSSDDPRSSETESCPAADKSEKECKASSSVLWRTNVNKKNSKHEVGPKDISRIISQRIISLDKEIVKEMKEKNDVSGTTVLVAVNMIKERTLIVANVGDSRAVLCDHKGNVIPLSYDHKPQQLKERKRITDAGGFVQFNGVWRVAGILATSRALGDYPLKDNNFVIPDPDILSFDLNHVKPKFMILASDGLWDILSNEEAAEFVKVNLEMLRKRTWTSSHSIAHELAKSLVLKSYKEGSLDNITVIVVLFDS